MDVKDFAARLVMTKIDAAGNPADAGEALDSLLGGSKGFDVNELVGKFRNSGGELVHAADSWLGDVANAAITAAQVQDALGRDRIEAFATRLGIDSDTASRKLAVILPLLVDTSSQNGELLDAVGALDGLAGFASNLLSNRDKNPG